MKLGGLRRASSSLNVQKLLVMGGLLALAGILVVQGVLASADGRAHEESAQQIEALASSLSARVQKHAKDFRAATTQAAGDVAADLALARKQSPTVSDLRWWDRQTLDMAYSSNSAAAVQGFARIADAERLMAGNESMLSVASFARVPKVQDPVLVLSARHADKVVQVLRPSSDILSTFREEAPEGMVVALVQDGQAVAVLGAATLDLTALDVVSVGPSRLSLAYQQPAPSSPWLGTWPLQAMAAAVLTLLALAMWLLPLLRRRSTKVPEESPAPEAPAFRPAPVSALPSSSSRSASNTPSGDGAPQSVSSGFANWFGPHGLVFEEAPTHPLPDSAQVRALMRALSEQLGGLSGRVVVLASDGRALSETLSKWSAEALSACGATVQRVAPLPLSAIPLAASLAPKGDAAPEAFLWMGDGREGVEASGLRVYRGSSFWAEEDYGRLRLRLSERVSSPNVTEGEIVELPPSSLVAGQVEKLSIAMQVERPIRMVVDFGNSPVSLLATEAWEAVGIDLIPLHAEVDLSFPNIRARDSSGWSSLTSTVRQFRADFGAGVSIDGSSFVVINEDGQAVRAERVVALLAADLLSRHPGARIEFSPEGLSEEVLASAIRSAGGIPSPNPDLILDRPLPDGVELLAAATPLGGVLLRFRDDQGAPDVIHALARIAVLLSFEDQPLEARLDEVSPAS